MLIHHKFYVQFAIFLFTKYHNFMDNTIFVTPPLLCEKHNNISFTGSQFGRLVKHLISTHYTDYLQKNTFLFVYVRKNAMTRVTGA